MKNRLGNKDTSVMIDYLESIMQSTICSLREYESLMDAAKHPVTMAVIPRETAITIGLSVIANIKTYFDFPDESVLKLNPSLIGEIILNEALISTYMPVSFLDRDDASFLSFMSFKSRVFKELIVDKIPYMDINPDVTVSEEDLVEYRISVVTTYLLGGARRMAAGILDSVFKKFPLISNMLNNHVLGVVPQRGNLVIMNYGDIDAIYYYKLTKQLSLIISNDSVEQIDDTLNNRDVEELIKKNITDVDTSDMCSKVRANIIQNETKHRKALLRKPANQNEAHNNLDRFNRLLVKPVPRHKRISVDHGLILSKVSTDPSDNANDDSYIDDDGLVVICREDIKSIVDDLLDNLECRASKRK